LDVEVVEPVSVAVTVVAALLGLTAHAEIVVGLGLVE